MPQWKQDSRSHSSDPVQPNKQKCFLKILIKALLFFRNEKRDGMKRERNEIVEPEKRTGGGGRRPTEAEWRK